MALHYHIHPQYAHLQPLIAEVPRRFDNEGSLMYQVRNTIKRMELNENIWNVKSFQIPHFINRLAYRYFRQSKAARSYLYSLRLLELGVGTPQPIAYIEEHLFGGLSRSYYISQQIDYDYTLGDLLRRPPRGAAEMIARCIRFISDFHRKGVCFHDLSVGNILVKICPDGTPLFYLVDVNRTQFFDRPLTCSESVKPFCRLDTTPEQKEDILRQYASVSGFDYDEVKRHYAQHSRRDKQRRRLKIFHLRRGNDHNE